jgi:glycosyltransferase involved in cell wall biosynthesis
MQRLCLYIQQQTPTYVCIAKDSKLDGMLANVTNNPLLQLQSSSWKNIFSNAKSLANFIDHHAIDVLHLHWTKDLPLCVFAKQLSQRKPKLVQSRHMNMTRFKSDFYHRYLYKNIDLMIAVTERVKQQITRYVPEKICPEVSVSYIGTPAYQHPDGKTLDTLRQQYALEDSFVIVLAGRIEPAKGQALLIDALQELNNPNIKILFIGEAMESAYLEQLQETISDKGLTNQVAFTGFVNNVQNLMAISDCVVLATDKETFGMVLVESMHTGTAVIASDSGGPLEIIEHNKDGLLFKSGDAKDLAKQLKQYIDHTHLRYKYAIAGQAKALNRFANDKQFNEVLELLISV